MQEITIKQKVQAVKQIFEKDIIEFAKFFYKSHLKLETPDFHKEIYSVYMDTDQKKIAIGAPRSHAKSTITDLIYLSWAIIHQKAKFVLLVSDTYSQAVLFLDTLKAEFESNEKLKAMYGDLTSKVWSESEIMVKPGVLIKAIGAGQKVRGLKFRDSRPDLIIVDDLENDEAVMSKERREKLERWFNGALVPSMAKGGRLIVIGTILHYDSLLSKMLSNDKYTEYWKKTYRAIVSETERKTLWKEHLDYDALLRIKEEYASKGQSYLFYQEYQNDPISDENRSFKLEYLTYFSDDELKNKITNTFITIDRAYSTAKTADYTGVIVNRVDRDNFWYILKAERFKGNEPEFIEYLFQLVDFFNPTKVAIEQKAFEYTFKPALEDEMRRRNRFFAVEPLKDNGINKTLRIEGLIPRFNTRTIKFQRNQTDLFDELLRFPMGDYDDLADALAYQLQIAKPPSTTSYSANLDDIKELESISYEEWT